MLNEILPAASVYGRGARQFLARRSENKAIEALFLQSLREGASDFNESQNAELLKRLVKRCRRELNMDKETFRFLSEGLNDVGAAGQISGLTQTWKLNFDDRRRRSLRPRIVLLLSDGQAIRTFLLTDVCKKLARWADLFILSPHAIGAEVAALGPHARFFPIPPLRRSRFDYLVGYLGYLYTESPTGRRFAERLNENLLTALKAGQPLNTTLRIWQIAAAYQSWDDYLQLYSWSLKLFAYTHCLREATSLLKELDADLIFNTSAVSWSPRLWTRSAALNGLPIVSNVISWDNMSTKTLLDEFVDKYLIWSDEMDEDFTMSLPFVRRKRRVIVGTPQFEPILQEKGLVSRQEFLGRYGLDPDKQLILYTTGSKTLFPREADCLDYLLAHWRSNLRDRASIMVRMHPKDRRGRYEGVMAKFPEVPFTTAGQTLGEEDEWVPEREDIALLVNQLHHCDVIINVASTMTLEGFVIDKPSINIGFSLGLSVSARYPMEDYYKSRHYRDIVDTGAARLVADLDQLYAAIDDVLDRKTYDVAKQREVLRKKCRYAKDSSRRIDFALRRHALFQSRWLRRSLGLIASRHDPDQSPAEAIGKSVGSNDLAPSQRAPAATMFAKSADS